MSSSESMEWLAKMMGEFYGQQSGCVTNVDFPWGRLSRLSGGMREGKVVLLGGPQNTGKSFFVMMMGLAIQNAGHSWKYLPLEDSKQDYLMRALGAFKGSYRMIDVDSGGAEDRMTALEEFKDVMLALEPHICPNPMEDGHQGKFTADQCLRWLEKHKGERVLIVDPTTRISFTGKNKWEAEEDFIDSVLAIAAGSKSTFVFVTHSKSRDGVKAKMPLTIEDLQGSTHWRKSLHVVLLLDAHEEMESRVCVGPNMYEQVTHNRTVTIGKTRYGKGSRTRLAFNQHLTVPRFDELGIIVREKRGK